MSDEIDLSRLQDPFPVEDIEWRVSRAGMGAKGIFCMVLAYITARAIQKRLDDVCGPENWRNEEPRILEINSKGQISAFACGIGIRCGDEWITKWDVAEPTNVEPAKGGFSGAMKRAGAQWGIGRYLYRLPETFAETSETSPGRGWNYAKLPEKHGGAAYFWKPPGLPAWALPREPEHEVSPGEVAELKQAWRRKFAPECRNPKELAEGFERFAHSIVGEFPIADDACWLRDAMDKCQKQITATEDPGGVDADVPFGE